VKIKFTVNKGIWAGLVAIAFVAGSITIGTMVYASGDKNGKPFEAIWDAITELQNDFDDLFEQLTTLEDKVDSMESNPINCNNEYILDGNFPDFDLSPICEANIVPLSFDAGTDQSATGVYTLELLPHDEDDPDSPLLALYEASCDIISDGSVTGSYLNGLTISQDRDSTSNDGLITEGTEDGSIQHSLGVFTDHNSFPTVKLRAIIFVLDLSDLPSPLPTAEEVIGSFTITFQIVAFDWLGDRDPDFLSDEGFVTYTCNP